MNPTAQPASDPPAAPRQFRRASLSTGAFEFVPVPFLDEWLIKRQRRGMIRSILESRGLDYDPEVPRILAGGGRSLVARLGSMLRGLVLKPLKKLFRTVFFWLTARSAARTAVETYFLARFLHHPDLGRLTGPSRVSRSDARRLIAIFVGVSRNIDLQAASSAVARVTSIFRQGGKKPVEPQEVSGVIEEEAPGFIAEFDRRIAARLREEESSG